MEIHVSCACMFEGNIMPWVQTDLFSPQGKYTRKYWRYHIIYRVAVAKEINCILHWALPICTGTHLRTSSFAWEVGSDMHTAVCDHAKCYSLRKEAPGRHLEAI